MCADMIDFFTFIPHRQKRKQEQKVFDQKHFLRPVNYATQMSFGIFQSTNIVIKSDVRFGEAHTGKPSRRRSSKDSSSNSDGSLQSDAPKMASRRSKRTAAPTVTALEAIGLSSELDFISSSEKEKAVEELLNDDDDDPLFAPKASKKRSKVGHKNDTDDQVSNCSKQINHATSAKERLRQIALRKTVNVNKWTSVPPIGTVSRTAADNISNHNPNAAEVLSTTVAATVAFGSSGVDTVCANNVNAVKVLSTTVAASVAVAHTVIGNSTSQNLNVTEPLLTTARNSVVVENSDAYNDGFNSPVISTGTSGVAHLEVVRQYDEEDGANAQQSDASMQQTSSDTEPKCTSTTSSPTTDVQKIALFDNDNFLIAAEKEMSSISNAGDPDHTAAIILLASTGSLFVVPTTTLVNFKYRNQTSQKLSDSDFADFTLSQFDDDLHFYEISNATKTTFAKAAVIDSCPFANKNQALSVLQDDLESKSLSISQLKNCSCF